jgi:tRNA modification GTPase
LFGTTREVGPILLEERTAPLVYSRLLGKENAMTDTIAAIATPEGRSALGIIRVSGPDTGVIGDRVLTLFSGVPFSQCAAREVHRAWGHEPRRKEMRKEQKEQAPLSRIDDLTVVRYAKPASYTGEDGAELFCHGSPLILQLMLSALIQAGARLALPGEFTRRAFLNGKTDLQAAEAVMDLIDAQGKSGVRLALNHLSGRTGRRIAALRDRIIEVTASLMVQIDYPEEDIEEILPDAHVKEIREEVDSLLATYDTGRALLHGIPTAILGRPNVGKSTLMNFLTGRETSIVTDVPGTTRDVIEQPVRMGNLTLLLADTAGIRDTRDTVEAIGVERAVGKAGQAKLLLCVFDVSAPAEEDDLQVLEAARGKTAVAVLNKSDLPEAFVFPGETKDYFAGVVSVSAKKETGLKELQRTIARALRLDQADAEQDDLIANVRHFQSLSRASQALGEALSAMEQGFGGEIAALELERAARELGEITGQTVSEEIVDRIFERFCLGK